jgi:PAS domain-containing protein
LESAELGAWDYNFNTGDVFWDEQCRTQWGIQEGNSFKYTAAIDCIHPEDRDATDKAVKRVLSKDSDGKYHTEFRVVWPDGSVHWIAAHGRVYFDGEGEQRSPVRFIGVNREITDEKHAEEKQQESQERLALAADAGQVGMFDLNIESGELQWTRQHEINFGYEPTTNRLLKSYCGADLRCCRSFKISAYVGAPRLSLACALPASS